MACERAVGGKCLHVGASRAAMSGTSLSRARGHSGRCLCRDGRRPVVPYGGPPEETGAFLGSALVVVSTGMSLSTQDPVRPGLGSLSAKPPGRWAKGRARKMAEGGVLFSQGDGEEARHLSAPGAAEARSRESVRRPAHG